MHKENIFKQIEENSSLVETGFKNEGKLHRIMKEDTYQKIKKRILEAA